jgi:ABC-type uncharacterized transport system permease subunit
VKSVRRVKSGRDYNSNQYLKSHPKGGSVLLIGFNMNKYTSHLEGIYASICESLVTHLQQFISVQPASVNGWRFVKTQASRLSKETSTCMLSLYANVIALTLYTAAAIFFSRKFARQQSITRSGLRRSAAVALVFHGLGVLSLSFASTGFLLSVSVAASLIFWVVNCIVLISSFKKELHNLFLLLFPLSAVVIASTMLFNDPDSQSSLSYSLAPHVVFSILAYSLMTIASLQAVLLAYQNHALKHKNLNSNTRLMPPLQTMESLLFELLWIGEILLTLAILSGFWFLEDMFAQHLAQKTVFALTAWFIYALLLWGRFQMGWRGNKAIRWALAGFVCLMLAYFGSRVVLEVILHRV